MMEKSNLPGPKILVVILTVIATMTVADQYTKGLVEASLPLGGRINVIPGFFDIVFIRNRGAAFGFLANIDSQWIRWGFTAFTVVALGALAVIYHSFPHKERLGRVAVVMIASGAMGNLVDRLERGSVTDFLLFYIGGYQWPAFNLADSLITVGVSMLAYSLVFHMPEDHPPEPDPNPKQT